MGVTASVESEVRRFGGERGPAAEAARGGESAITHGGPRSSYFLFQTLTPILSRKCWVFRVSSGSTVREGARLGSLVVSRTCIGGRAWCRRRKWVRGALVGSVLQAMRNEQIERRDECNQEKRNSKRMVSSQGIPPCRWSPISSTAPESLQAQLQNQVCSLMVRDRSSKTHQ